jgi:hypothetical protein
MAIATSTERGILWCRQSAQDKANKAAELEREEGQHVETAKKLEAAHNDLV